MFGLIWIALVFTAVLHCSRACDMTIPELVDWAEKRIHQLGGCRALSGGVNPVKYRVPNVKVFVYQQDEEEMLADFLQYYSYVFEAKNVVVIDRDSKKDSICQTLALFHYCGTEIITPMGTGIRSKGHLMTKEMHRHRHSFLIPLDADEFIFPFAHNSLSQAVVDRDLLWEAFEKLPIDGRKYKLKLYKEARPERITCDSSATHFTTDNETTISYRRAVQNTAIMKLFEEDVRSKTFFHSHGFMNTDDGNHYGRVKHDDGMYNMHPAVVANFSRFFAKLDAQMVHYSIGSYRGARDKYFRAAASYGFHGASNCSKPQVAIQYCEPCKQFINGTDQGRAFYRGACRAPPIARSSTSVADWFTNHTLSMLELLGGPPQRFHPLHPPTSAPTRQPTAAATKFMIKMNVKAKVVDATLVPASASRTSFGVVWPGKTVKN